MSLRGSLYYCRGSGSHTRTAVATGAGAAMLLLRDRLLSAVRAVSPLPPASFLNRLLRLSTAPAPPARFVPEEFLITTCGLTPAQALRSSRYLAHLKSPSKPEAVLAFFADNGLAKADVVAAIARDSRILCAQVDKTLAPRFAQLRDIGLSRAQISRFITVTPYALQTRTMIPSLAFYISLLGSYDKVHMALRRCLRLLGSVERLVKPNIAFLQQCGLTDDDIANLVVTVPRMFMLKPEGIKEIVVSAHEKLGVPHDSSLFKLALAVTYCINPQRIDAKLDFFKKTLGCSESELGFAVRNFPNILKISEVKLVRTVEFLKMEVGLETKYIVHRPAVLTYSMEKRLKPRHYILKLLRGRGLVKDDSDFYTAVSLAEKKFAVRFIERYREIIPRLAVHYAAACAGQVPPEMQQRKL